VATEERATTLHGQLNISGRHRSSDAEQQHSSSFDVERLEVEVECSAAACGGKPSVDVG